MKILLLILAVLFIAFVIIQLWARRGQKNIETYPYVVQKQYGALEIRNYEAALFTSVNTASEGYKRSSSRGFSILAGYIFGNNARNEKIAMTAPVTTQLDDSVTMMFMVPKKYTKEALPQPNQPGITFKEEPAKTVAAISFRGWASDEKIEKYKRKLMAALEAEGIPYSNRFYFLGYNPPYEVFNRKNEVIVELP